MFRSRTSTHECSCLVCNKSTVIKVWCKQIVAAVVDVLVAKRASVSSWTTGRGLVASPPPHSRHRMSQSVLEIINIKYDLDLCLCDQNQR